MVGGGDGPLAGKILVTRTPILPPGASKELIEAATERELLDAEDEVFCPLCAGGEHGPGRNDPCPCGSGRKYKKCCL
jgi:uncharacterized protein YecA (UPF0149 family)